MTKDTTNNHHWFKNIISGAALKYGLPILTCLWGLIFLTPLAFLTFVEAPLTPTIIVTSVLMPIVLSGGIGITFRLMLYYQKQEYEKEMLNKDAELRTVKKDISPHFLLNTLNNIYALTTFDTKRAQEAIIQLSHLLRTLLYKDTNLPTPLADSIAFMECYVKLMQLRTADNVKINVDVDIPKDSKIMIAQMLIVPLVENAFKHGIHPVKPSFINVEVHANEKKVEIKVENSNFPKDNTDKSGHGIGLYQELTRLNLIYPNQYEWIRGTNEDNTIYTSHLTLFL